MTRPRPPLSPAIAGTKPYVVPRHPAPIRFKLDSGEGLASPGDAFGPLAEADADALIRRYPDRAELEAQLAARLGCAPAQVLVTAGGDDALDRACRALLAPGRSLVFPTPSFEMIARYAGWTGAQVRTVPWPEGPYPVDAVVSASDATTTAIAVVSPNNPTGAVISAAELQRLSDATPGVALLLDHAYVEFAGEDLTAFALTLPDVLVFRTLSKAWGMAGLRVGYVAGPVWLIDALRAAGNPYSVSGPSLHLAAHSLRDGEAAMHHFTARVRSERAALEALLHDHGVRVCPSQGNFAFARGPRVRWIADALAGLGVAVRTWPGRPDLADAVRITLPGEPEAAAALMHGVASALAPEAILFDMDGVLVDVSGSYRTAILTTAARYGVTITSEDVARAKAAGDANNDWVLTQRLLAERGVDVPLSDVTATFEALYQGTASEPGLRATERPLTSRAWLEALSQRLPLAVVTGRPRKDAVAFLEEHDLTDLFPVVICMEDGPAKPDPAPVRAACRALGVQRAWLIGDTVDDARAAAAAAVVPLGVLAPGEAPPQADVLRAAGAARVLPSLSTLTELLP